MVPWHKKAMVSGKKINVGKVRVLVDRNCCQQWQPGSGSALGPAVNCQTDIIGAPDRKNAAEREASLNVTHSK